MSPAVSISIAAMVVYKHRQGVENQIAVVGVARCMDGALHKRLYFLAIMGSTDVYIQHQS